jgi:hypothetical protein
VSAKQKKNCLRIVLAAVYLVGMVCLYTLNDSTHGMFWLWPLAIAIFVYNVFLWAKRCPSCREEFALDPCAVGVMFTTYTCRHCGAQCERPNGGHTGGGGP